jgi:hypothetical protein
LSIDPASLATMRLQLPEAAEGLVLQTWPLEGVSSEGASTQGLERGADVRPTAQVPEPLSCLVWGAVVLGAVRWRRRFRPRS